MRLSTIAIATLLVAGVAFVVLGTRNDWFRCDGQNVYSIGGALNLGGCAVP